jgi:hypothetical protein
MKHGENGDKAYKSSLINEGKLGDNFYGIFTRTACTEKDDIAKCYSKALGVLEDRCKLVVADQSLLFIAFGLAAAAGALTLFIWKKGKRGGGSGYYT